jgi:hypothetical protein
MVLGLLMFTFGFLKFVNPTIDGWFHVQIQQSHLPHSAILIGKIAEIVTGILFLLPRFRPWPPKWEGRILLIACSSLFLRCLRRFTSTFSPEFRPRYYHSVLSLR